MSLKLPTISLPIFSGREILNYLQKVRDVSKVCDILGLLQYPSFARANTVSELMVADLADGSDLLLYYPQE